MKKCFAALVALMAWMFPILCEAQGQASEFEVEQVRVDNDGRGYIKFSSNLAGSPAACTTANYVRMLAFDVNTPGGRAIMALALTAKSSGKRIFARGTGACAHYGMMEDWRWGYLLE